MIIPKAFLRERLINRMREFEAAALEPIKNQDELQSYLLASIYANEDEIACDYLDYVYKIGSDTDVESDVEYIMSVGIACGMPLNTVLKFAKEHLGQADYDTIFRDYEKVFNETWSAPDQIELYDDNTCSETVMDQDGNKVYYDSDTDEWVLDGPGSRTRMLVKRWRQLNDWEK